MSMDDIARAFPQMRCAVRSDESFNYNCLAFVLGDYNNWWEPGVAGHYWPPGFPEDLTVETVSSIIAVHGFTVECPDPNNPHTDSIAIFADGQEWTHFAKFSNREWCSKLGEDHDVMHSSLDDLECDKYGRLVKILSRES